MAKWKALMNVMNIGNIILLIFVIMASFYEKQQQYRKQEQQRQRKSTATCINYMKFSLTVIQYFKCSYYAHANVNTLPSCATDKTQNIQISATNCWFFVIKWNYCRKYCSTCEICETIETSGDKYDKKPQII